MNRRHAAAAVLAVVLTACGGAPEVPHTIAGHSDAYCATCHRDGTDGASVTPHADRSGCVTCHTPRGDAAGSLPGR